MKNCYVCFRFMNIQLNDKLAKCFCVEMGGEGKQRFPIQDNLLLCKKGNPNRVDLGELSA